MKHIFNTIVCLFLLLCSFEVHATLLGKARFATVLVADSLLQQKDEYINGMSRFDIDARVQKPGSTQEEHMHNITANLREWDAGEKEKIITQLNSIQNTIDAAGFKLNFPPQILFIKSTMQDEGGATGYNRRHAIVLKTGSCDMPATQLRKLLIHELFHILTRHDKTFRRDIYTVIGFTLMNEVAYPAAIRDLKISNPDAPFKDSYIKLKRGDREIECMMILYSTKPYSSGSFFEYIEIGLLELKGTDKKVVAMKEAQPIIYGLNEVDGFFEQIGNNTKYIIDPEEALADNFVHVFDQTADLPSPRIVENMKKRMQQN